MPKAYFVLYGAFQYEYSKQDGVYAVFGDKCSLGWTIGEEVIFK